MRSSATSNRLGRTFNSPTREPSPKTEPSTAPDLGLVAPPAGDQLGVVRLGLRRSDDDVRQAVGAGLEAAHRLCGNAHGVPPSDVVDLVVQLHAPSAFDH